MCAMHTTREGKVKWDVRACAGAVQIYIAGVQGLCAYCAWCSVRGEQFDAELSEVSLGLGAGAWCHECTVCAFRYLISISYLCGDVRDLPSRAVQAKRRTRGLT